MKFRLKRIILIIIAITMFLSACTFTVFAEDNQSPFTEVTPRWSNCHNCSATFVIDDSGNANIAAIYQANEATFSQAKISVQIQKRFLGVFWKVLDIGYPNNEWTESSYELNGDFHNAFALDSKGTYRANITIMFYGMNDTVDTIEKTIECKYS